MKIKIVIVLFVVLALSVVSAKKSNKQNEDEKGKSLKKVLKECQKNDETKVDATVLKKLKKHKQVDLPANYGDHKLCVMKGIGFINEDNTVNEENLKKKITKKAQQGQNVDAILTQCKVAKATPKDTAIQMETCLNSNNIDL